MEQEKHESVSNDPASIPHLLLGLFGTKEKNREFIEALKSLNPNEAKICVRSFDVVDIHFWAEEKNKLSTFIKKVLGNYSHIHLVKNMLDKYSFISDKLLNSIGYKRFKTIPQGQEGGRRHKFLGAPVIFPIAMQEQKGVTVDNFWDDD